jgi:nucleoside-diphosphate-sugar epimerase
MRFFVTGGTGYIGSNLISRLRQKGHEVNALVRDPLKAGELADSGVRLIHGDLSDLEALRNGMSGTDGVFHLAAWYRIGEKDQEAAYQANVDGTKNVLSVMQEMGIKKGVYTSSLAIFSNTKGLIPDEEYFFNGKHLSIYDRTKWQAHYKVAQPMIEQGLPLVIVIPGAVYGPDDPSMIGSSLNDYLQGKFPFVPKDMKVCWGFIDDVVDAHIKAMERGKPGESYITAGPAHSLEEVLKSAEKITGIKAPSIKISPFFLKFLSLKMRFWEKIFRIPPRYRSESLRIIAGVSYLGSSDKALNELGCKFRSLTEGLEITLNHYLRQNSIVNK